MILTTKVRFLLCITALTILFTNCQQAVTDSPTLIPDISEEKMIDILLDTHLAEAAVQTEKTHQKDSLLYIYYQEIYRIHDITKEDFERNLEAWFNDPIKSNNMYEKIIEKLKKSETNYSARPKKPDFKGKNISKSDTIKKKKI